LGGGLLEEPGIDGGVNAAIEVVTRENDRIVGSLQRV
jgi:hypothetical protein